jgi:hypothetical protein
MSARRRAKVVLLTRPADDPAGRAIDLGGDLERIAGHLRGLVLALREFDVARGHPAEMDLDEQESRSWLYEALLDAVEHEQDRLQALAPRVYQRAHR